MDPDKTLNKLRTIIDREASDEIFELFDALDHWLSGGGFLPKDWQGRHD